VEAYVSELNGSYRAVLLMLDVKGLTARVIAELLGAATGSVKFRVHRGRGNVRLSRDPWACRRSLIPSLEVHLEGDA
jgi:DNA-directed RNA polymerase specialized sigma24 family protein